MAHLSLQLGAAAVVPFGARHPTRGTRNWRLRALREAAAVAGRDGGPSRKHRRRALSPAVPPRRAPVETVGV